MDQPQFVVYETQIKGGIVRTKITACHKLKEFRQHGLYFRGIFEHFRGDLVHGKGTRRDLPSRIHQALKRSKLLAAFLPRSAAILRFGRQQAAKARSSRYQIS